MFETEPIEITCPGQTMMLLVSWSYKRVRSQWWIAAFVHTFIL